MTYHADPDEPYSDLADAQSPPAGDELKDEIFRYLNCYEISAGEVNAGMTYIDSQEAENIANDLLPAINAYILSEMQKVIGNDFVEVTEYDKAINGVKAMQRQALTAKFGGTQK